MTRSLPVRILLDGALNVRDLGGYPTEDGNPTQSGRLFRSDSLQNLSKRDVETLLNLKLDTVIDLRDPQEIEQSPNSPALLEAVTYHRVPLFAELAAAGVVHAPPDTLGEYYVLAAQYCSDAFRTVFNIIAEANGSVLFHCTAGKDRTGITAALLLRLAGVARKQILEDFSASGPFLEPAMEELRAFIRRMYGSSGRADFLSTDPSHIERFVNYIDEVCGGPASYLTDCGVSEDRLASIQSRLMSE